MTPLTLRSVPPALSMPLREGPVALEMAGLVQAMLVGGVGGLRVPVGPR